MQYEAEAMYLFLALSKLFSNVKIVFRGYLCQLRDIFPSNHVTFCLTYRRPELLEDRIWLCIVQFNLVNCLSHLLSRSEPDCTTHRTCVLERSRVMDVPTWSISWKREYYNLLFIT